MRTDKNRKRKRVWLSLITRIEDTRSWRKKLSKNRLLPLYVLRRFPEGSNVEYSRAGWWGSFSTRITRDRNFHLIYQECDTRDDVNFDQSDRQLCRINSKSDICIFVISEVSVLLKISVFALTFIWHDLHALRKSFSAEFFLLWEFQPHKLPIYCVFHPLSKKWFSKTNS